MKSVLMLALCGLQVLLPTIEGASIGHHLYNPTGYMQQPDHYSKRNCAAYGGQRNHGDRWKTDGCGNFCDCNDGTIFCSQNYCNDGHHGSAFQSSIPYTGQHGNPGYSVHGSGGFGGAHGGDYAGRGSQGGYGAASGYGNPGSGFGGSFGHGVGVGHGLGHGQAVGVGHGFGLGFGHGNAHGSGYRAGGNGYENNIGHGGYGSNLGGAYGNSGYGGGKKSYAKSHQYGSGHSFDNEYGKEKSRDYAKGEAFKEETGESHIAATKGGSEAHIAETADHAVDGSHGHATYGKKGNSASKGESHSSGHDHDEGHATHGVKEVKGHEHDKVYGREYGKKQQEGYSYEKHNEHK